MSEEALLARLLQYDRESPPRSYPCRICRGGGKYQRAGDNGVYMDLPWKVCPCPIGQRMEETKARE